MTSDSRLGTAIHRVGTAAVVLSAVAALSSCSSSGGTKPAAASPPRATATVTSSAVPSTSSTAVTSPSPSVTSTPVSSSAAAGPSGCANSQLAVTSKSLSGATSHGGLLVVFTNSSKQTCSLVGYPGAAALDSQGTQIVQAKRTLQGFLGGCGCTAPERVLLKPGGAASAVVEGSNGGGDECLRGKAVLVTPPNTKKATRFPFEDYSCSFQVHPVAAGTKAHLPS